jgi:excisionase family DNA binding protein
MTTPTTNTTPISESEPWVNTAAACKHLSISAPTIRRWIKAGRLKPKRTPTGELRFRRSELDALLD